MPRSQPLIQTSHLIIPFTHETQILRSTTTLVYQTTTNAPLRVSCILLSSLLSLQKLEDCSPSGLDCSPTTISWESTADIQSGDLLLVEIDDSQLISTQNNNNDNQDVRR